MNDNPPPLGIHTDDQLEARITAWVLGEASPFEAAELEALCAADPELQLFLNRTKALNALLKEAETTSEISDPDWKLSGKRRIALAPILGPIPFPIPHNDNRIRRASIRAAFGIAAVFLITLFISPMFIRQRKKADRGMLSELSVSVPMAMEADEPQPAARSGKPSDGLQAPERRAMAASEPTPQIHIGGQVRSTGSVDFKEGMTLGEAVKTAGGATEFGSAKRIKVYRDGKTQTYDLADERLAQIELQPNDTIEVPQKNFFGCGASKSELAEAAAEGKENKPSPPASSMAKAIAAATSAEIEIPVPELAAAAPSQDFGDGADFGGGWGDGSGDGGGFARKGNNESLAMNERSYRNDSAVYNGPLGGARIPGIPADPAITAGNRSGDGAISRNNVDAILNNPDRVASGEKPPSKAKAFLDSPAEPSAESLKGAQSDPAPFAEQGGIPGLSQREITRRELSVADADRQLVEGRDAYANGDYGKAREKFDQALSQLPDSPALEERRSAIADHLGKASLAEAQNMRKVGKYDEARDMLEKAAAAGGENQEEIKTELGYLDDPIRTNPARVSGPLTEDHAKQVDEVRRKLYMAEGNYELGKYDDAKKAYEDTLRIDPYNKAARRGMERVEAAKSDYYRAAYDHTRAEMQMKVDESWELELPAEGENNPAGYAWSSRGENQKAAAGDVKYQMNTRAGSERGTADEPMKMDNLFSSSLGQADDIRWGGLKNDLSAYGDTDALDLFAGNADRTTFDAYQAPQMNGRFDGFVNYGAHIAGEPKQVDITTKHVEITQANDKELGFDWILSPFEDASVVSRSGANSSLNVIREFTYPTEFEAPELPVTDAVTPAFPILVDESDADLAPILGDIPVIGRLFKEKQLIDLADLSQEIPAAQEPFSTFSLNISDASFQLALAAVEKGERPDPASIKPEQFYNAVDYGDPAPSSLEPVAAAIDQTAHPVIPGRNLVRVAIRTASTGRSAAQPLRLTLLVDQSGSMARADRRAAMDTALAQLATLLTENDRITVIGFSRTPRLIADSLPGNEAAKISDLINTTASEGGTNLEQAFNLSSELALRHKLDGAQNRIVLFTDGAANLGDADPDRLAERVKELRQQGLAFDIAGIGTNDTNDRLLSELARHGNGRYYLVGENAGSSLAAQLAGAFRPAAENVKVQVKLNSERVGGYKLIGFEKDRLKTEDFHDDSVDAAELAADEAGVAIYQVETLPEGTGEIGEVSVRFRDTASGEMVERAWTIPHDPSTPAFDKAAPQTQLATLALMAAQKLQGGPLADAIRFSDHAQTIAKLKQTYANDAKAQRLLTLINALR